jgi:hypothetical protein
MNAHGCHTLPTWQGMTNTAPEGRLATDRQIFRRVTKGFLRAQRLFCKIIIDRTAKAPET